MNRRQLLVGAPALALPWVAHAQQAITLNGAVQFNDDHVFTRALVRFEELVKQYYTAQPINFILHKNSSLGLEKQYFEYMSAGRGAVDYGIVSPAHMSTFSRAAPFVDAPFLFRDLAQWNKVLDQDLFAPVATEIERRSRVGLIGYAGGGVRNIFANKRITDMAGLRGLKVRVQGAPIWSRTFQAAGMSPSVIAYNEIYNGIQNNVIEAGENEAAGVEAMRFYEVAPNLILTQHAITIRPICFASQTLARLPAPLQEAIRRAGKEAGTFGRHAESTEDGQKITELEQAGRLRRVEFTDRDALKRAVDPVMVAYAREVDAEAIYARINAVTS
ncbi:TRAP transporter substrate-binding protein [Roseomonas terrae]|jgi:TRAP-type C4-dicarboxylate transport system substrate-binding protein|uniref:TRAP transporter substrate-binding protein n=1 Tax=Neoroseomonas terrae TaxID=424799 RepID=A0ABS5EMJ2_9PROT|nr:TRAP transporter substrate-binding protein [Neoroseomonas terrae]MBR0652237.1 TRAP transporter substrate-binding protein [Neoroseomonas terrae]